MKKLLTLLALLIGAGANAQTLGDILTWKKGPGLGDAKTYTTPVNSSLFSLNGSGNFALLAQSNFANASHTHTASAITDFNAVGDARWALIAHNHDIDNITGLQTALDALATTASLATLITEDPGAGVGMIESGSGVTPYILKNLKSGTGTTATANTGSVQVDIASNGVTNTMLDDMAQATIKGRASAAGTGDPTDLTANQVSTILDGATDPFVRTSAAGGSGTVSSVAVSGSDGIEVDSGSPVTTNGTIALGVNASTLKTHLSLNNVENTALSTWAGSTNITTLGTIATGVWNGTDVAVADGGTGSSTASGARTNLGATTVGSNLFTLTNPSALTYARINADNTVTARTMAQSRTDLALHPVTITAITGGSQSTTSTSLADVTGSTITFPDTGWYEFEYFVIHNSAATTTGAFLSVNTGGTMVKDYLTYCTHYDVSSTDKDTYCVDGYNSVIATTSSRATANNRCRMQGTIHVTTAGGMVLRFATEVNASAITITDLSGWYRNL